MSMGRRYSKFYTTKRDYSRNVCLLEAGRVIAENKIVLHLLTTLDVILNISRVINIRLLLEIREVYFQKSPKRTQHTSTKRSRYISTSLCHHTNKEMYVYLYYIWGFYFYIFYFQIFYIFLFYSFQYIKKCIIKNVRCTKRNNQHPIKSIDKAWKIEFHCFQIFVRSDVDLMICSYDGSSKQPVDYQFHRFLFNNKMFFVLPPGHLS